MNGMRLWDVDRGESLRTPDADIVNKEAVSCGSWAHGDTAVLAFAEGEHSVTLWKNGSVRRDGITSIDALTNLSADQYAPAV